MLVTGGVASLTPGYRLVSLSGLLQPVTSVGIQRLVAKWVARMALYESTRVSAPPGLGFIFGKYRGLCPRHRMYQPIRA
jgi:hypothetical protein